VAAAARASDVGASVDRSEAWSVFSALLPVTDESVSSVELDPPSPQAATNMVTREIE
jgi:hypothetical protein